MLPLFCDKDKQRRVSLEAMLPWATPAPPYQLCAAVSACVLAALHVVACNFLQQLCAHTASA